ncbi:F0F1 ATP synthase subunit delta [Rugamonas sp. CCM 8940]|uniref:F0F1 ATP synthase subunit delta n=1 Tax=Rugamonas sp. CCM 8940 TaxID=2765359 RepID=UPI0018F50D6F|nr:F0F1 ATP synthase subunit delta [Rugamonas sp. CCM 8940]MBJ7309066.1 F0F1 ATP synthase subunit delta [Rugamonas sp. CCM 8940]
MLIDWFTVGAQALNFIILVWLMKRFLYKPILDAIDAREKKIAAELADADAKKAEAQKERDTFQQKNDAFDQQRASLLSQVTDAAKAESQRLLEQARKTADELRVKRDEALKNGAKNLHQAISIRTQQEVFAIARKALTDLASASLEQRMTEIFIQRLQALDDATKAKFSDALKSGTAPALVRSAFELPAEQRSAIQDAVKQLFATDIPLKFDVAPDLVSGVELSTNGQKVAWNIADYLASLETGVANLLKEKTQPVSKVPSKPDKPPVPTPEIVSAKNLEIEPASKPEVATAPKPAASEAVAKTTQ